ncbi:MAG: hypothetical protein V4568_12615 [Pseudomonadota bacterium]
MDSTQPISKGRTVLAILFLLLIFGLVGHWDYEDALVTEHMVTQTTARTLMCEEKADNAIREDSQVNPRMVNVADHRFNEQAEEIFVLSCIAVTN